MQVQMHLNYRSAGRVQTRKTFNLSEERQTSCIPAVISSCMCIYIIYKSPDTLWWRWAMKEREIEERQKLVTSINHVWFQHKDCISSLFSNLTQAMKTETRPWRPTLCSPSVGTGWTAPPWLKISNETGIEIHLSEVVVCIYLPRHSAGLCRRFQEVNKTREREWFYWEPTFCWVLFTSC